MAFSGAEGSRGVLQTAKHATVGQVDRIFLTKLSKDKKFAAAYLVFP